MGWEADYYNVYEAARILEISPARVRQMLRAGELEGHRGEPVAEGVPGPWRLPSGAVHAARSVAGAGDAEATVAMSAGEAVVNEGAVGDAPSETSERLSEGVQDLREKAEALIAGLDKLEGRLEATEMEQLALKGSCGGRRSAPRVCGWSSKRKGCGPGLSSNAGRGGRLGGGGWAVSEGPTQTVPGLDRRVLRRRRARRRPAKSLQEV